MGIQTWLQKRRERKAREESYSKPPAPDDSIATLVPSGDSGTTIVYTPSGTGAVYGPVQPTPTPTTPTPSGVTTYPDITLPSTSVQQVTQQSLRGEVYDPTSQVYRRGAYDVGGTQFERIPTREEQRKIDIAQRTGELGYQLTGVSQKEFEELKDVQIEIASSSTKIQKITNELENKQSRFESDWKGFIKDGKFTGTQLEYEMYKRNYEKLDKDFNKYNKERIRLEGNIARYKRAGGKISAEGYLETPKVTIGGGLGLKGRDVPLSDFSKLYSPSIVTQVSGAIDVGAKQMFWAGGEAFGKVLGEKRKYTITKERLIPEKTLKGVYQPQFGTATEFDPITGRAKAKFEDITIKARTRPELYFTGEQLGEKVGTIGATGAAIGKYAIPYAGSIFFASEVVEEVKEVGGVKQFVKEKPLEAALIGTVVLGGTAYAGTKWLKTPIVKKIPSGYKVTTRGAEFFGTRVRISKRGVSLLPSERSLIEIKRVKIKKPKIELKASETIGYDITKEGKEFVKFPEQKLYQTSTKGERAIVRKFNKKTGKWEIVYRGIPTTKVGRKEYKKTIELFEKYKIKPKEIKPYLKYSPPKVIEQRLKEGLIEIKKTRATGEFKYLTEQPKLLIDKKLGIKTRGARTKQDDIFVERLVKDKFGVEAKGGIKTIKHKEKEILDITGLEFKGGILVSEEIGKGVVKKIPFKTIESVTIERYIPSLEKPTIFIDKGRTTLLRLDVLEAKGVRGGLGKKSSQQYLEQLYAPELKVAPILKPTIPKVVTKPIAKIDIPTKVELREIPLMVGGTRLREIPYAGQGLYERTEGVGVGAIQLKGVVQPSFIEMREEQRFIQPQIEMLKARQEFIQPLKEELKVGLDIKSAQEFIQPQKEVLKEIQLLKQPQLLKQAQLLRQVQLLKQAQISKQAIKKPILFKPIFKLEGVTDRLKKIAKEKPELFEVFGRRFGEEVKLGIFKTKTKAEKKLEKFLVKTLGAAGFVTKEGKKLKAVELELLKKKGFRPSKISEFLVVEKKEKRLRKKTTGKDIQYFRSKPLKGRKKGKSLFGI